MSGTDVAVIGVRGIGMVAPGDNVAGLIASAMADDGVELSPADVVVIASTIVSKAEGRFFDLDGVEPSDQARALAATTGKDPRLVEVILGESIAVSRAAPGVLVVRHRLGFISANAGVDFSNVGQGPDTGILLPVDPDASASSIRAALEAAGTSPIAVVITDTHGRAFRKGNVNVAIGVSGIAPVVDERGRSDLFGRVLLATVVPLADLVASAASLVTGEADEGVPVVIVRGLDYPTEEAGAAELNWPPESDLFA